MKKPKAERHIKRGKVAKGREAELTIRVRAVSSRQRPIEVKIRYGEFVNSKDLVIPNAILLIILCQVRLRLSSLL